MAEPCGDATVVAALTNPSVFNCSAQPGKWSDVARVCRRICVLRERGEFAEAERVGTDALAMAINELRTPADTDESIAAQVEALFAREAERVADAAVLAELLANQMADLRASATPQESGSKSARKSPARSAKPAAPARQPGADIADFIDDMIAQERAS